METYPGKWPIAWDFVQQVKKLIETGELELIEHEGGGDPYELYTFVCNSKATGCTYEYYIQPFNMEVKYSNVQIRIVNGKKVKIVNP